jgi:hypothetical protein
MTRFVIEEAERPVTPQLAFLRASVRARSLEESQVLQQHALDNRVPVNWKAVVSDFGVPMASHASGLTKSRGGANSFLGDYIVIPRTGLGKFVIFPNGWYPGHPTIEPFVDNLGLTDEQIANMNVTGLTDMSSGLMVSVPRDGSEFLLIDPRWLDRGDGGPPRPQAYLSNLGISWPNPASFDKCTGASRGPTGTTWAFPMSVGALIEIDDSAWPYGGIGNIKARFVPMGFPLPRGGKEFASGCFFRSGLGMLVPYNFTGGLVFFDILTGRMWLETFGHSWAGTNKLAGILPGGFGLSYMSARDADYIARYDELNHSLRRDDMGLGLVAGRNHFGRPLPLANGHILLPPAGASPYLRSDAVIINPENDTAAVNSFAGDVSWLPEYQRYLGGGCTLNGVTIATPDQAANFLTVFPVNDNDEFVPIRRPLRLANSPSLNRGT